MQIPAKISFRNMDHSDAVEARVRQKIAKLEQYYDRIVGCSVVVEAPHKHHHKGKLFQVHIVLSLPGEEVVVNRDAGEDHGHEDVYVAVRDAFEAARRQLKRYVRQIRQRSGRDDTSPELGA